VLEVDPEVQRDDRHQGPDPGRERRIVEQTPACASAARATAIGRARREHAQQQDIERQQAEVVAASAHAARSVASAGPHGLPAATQREHAEEHGDAKRRSLRIAVSTMVVAAGQCYASTK